MKNHRTFSRHRHLPASATLVLGMLMLALCLSAGLRTAHAQEAFVVPERYPQDRYETGWMKNPFTLKTAPVIAEKKSFAKDLVLHNIASPGGGEVLVVLANAKTKEFFRVRSSEPASNGMKIRTYKIGDLRKDSYVEVELNGEFAVLRPDDAFYKQMLAGNSARGSRGKGGIGGGAGAGPGGAEGAGKDATSPPVVTPNGLAPGGQGMGGGLPGAGPLNNTPRTPIERPQLPRGPGPTPPTPQDSPGSGQPVNIRPGPAPAGMPPQGAPPSRSGRRFFTAPISVTSVGGAPASAAP
jgi:hypothetical protein